MLPGFLRSARTLLFASLTIVMAAAIIGITWRAAEKTIDAQRADALTRTDATVTGLSANYSQQISRQILALDQSLDMMVHEWEADPRRFNLENARERSKVLTGISRDMFLADENGVIRQSTVSDFIGQSVGDLEAFRDAAEHANDAPKLFLGAAGINPIMRQWHLDAARTLHHPDGSFAGIIDADYRVSAINDVFASASPPGNGFAALINMTDGKLRATFGSGGGTPDANIADTPMFGAVDAADTGLWVGPSATDTVLRVHAFHRIPGRDLSVVTGIDRQEALNQVTAWLWQARIFAGAITALTVIVCLLILIALNAGRRRTAIGRENQALLAAAHALAEVSRAQSNAVERRLQATLAAIADGVAIFDAHLNLVEWNAAFPERCGVNASFIRTGMPAEDLLRRQAQAGYFGAAVDVEAEVERRAALLRAGNFGSSQSFQADGRIMELRCRPLAEGGFVALYTDVTEGRRARQALRDARDVLVREQAARMRFLGVIAHELRLRVAMLMRSVARVPALDAPEEALPGEVLPREALPREALPREALPREALNGVRRAGEAMANLATDTVEVPKMEAGTLELQPALIGVRPLLRDIVDAMQPAARDRGITLYLVVNEAAPGELIADPGRIRQIVTALIAEALRIAAPDTMWLMADRGEDNSGDTMGLRVTVRGFGKQLPEAVRAHIFPALNAIAVPGPSDGGSEAWDADRFDGRARDTGLGLAIAQYLTTLLGGHARCEGWSTIDGRTGNDFILTLPPDLLPGQRGRAPGESPAEGRPLPRTRVLLAGASTGLRQAEMTMLRRDGHMVDAVPTGEEAVRVLKNAPYDVVFLDTALSDMTIEALAGTIRDMSGPARAVPLIALAAPHDEAEERGWRDAGCDDVLTHNPTFEDLVAAIGRHVWLSRSMVPGLGSMPGLDDESEEGIPILAAARIAELRANIAPDELLEMVEECIADLFHRLPAMRRSLASGAPGAISAQAHAMVGMAGGYGMAVLEARLRAILTAVRLRRLDTIDGAAAVLEADLTRAAAALRRTFRQSHTERTDVRASP
jgi:signal transduction histidine kinase/CheY-like chemotaxis protein